MNTGNVKCEIPLREQLEEILRLMLLVWCSQTKALRILKAGNVQKKNEKINLFSD